ncbi:ribosomal RNA small subunit methyltransferase [Tanacetum coccineum]|uniref:Ribosomal RNA small subunit methyltransferase n=1 Tax=Tanacetum coccineum TaxID=301880 RepID=A0ABQ5JAQ7_9ASTR
MVLEGLTGWKLRRKKWTGTTERLIEDLESAYDNAPNMFSIRIHHGRKFRRYFDGHVNIFDMVDINIFIVVALNMMVVQLGYTCKSEPLYYNYLRPLTSLNEGLYALACEEDVCCLATLVRSFKLIEVYIEHGVTAVEPYTVRPPPHGVGVGGVGRDRATYRILPKTLCKSIAIIEHISKKMLLFTWHDSSEPTKEPVCDYVTPRSLPQYDFSTHCKDPICESITPRYMPHCMLTPPTDGSVITYTQLSGVQRVDTQDYVLPTIQSQFSDINLSFVSQQATASHVIKDVMRQLSFEETELDEEAGFGDVARSGIESFGLSHDDSYGVDDLYLNLNEPLDLNVSQIETQFELPVSKESDVVEDCVSFWEDVEQGNGQDDESAPSDGHFFYDVEGIDSVYETQYDVQSSEDAGTDDDDDFLVDEENEIIEPDVDVHLFGISMDVPFDNIGVTNLVPDNVLEGEDVDGFDSDRGNDNESSYYIRRRLAKLNREMEGVINASGQCQVLAAVGLDSNSRIYPLAYALVKAESRAIAQQHLQAQQAKPAVGQYGSGGSGVGVVIGLSVVDCAGGAGVGVGSQGSSHTRWTKRRVQTVRISLQKTTLTQPASQPSTNSQVLVTETRNADGRELGDEDDMSWYTDEMMEQAEKIADDLRDIAYYIVEKTSRDYSPLPSIGYFMELGRFEQYSGTWYYPISSQHNFQPLFVVLRMKTKSDESKNEKRAKGWREEFEYKISLFEINLMFGINAFDLDKGIDVMKDKVSQEHICEEEVPLKNNIGKQSGDLVEMPSEAVEQRMDDHVPDDIDSAKGEQVPNHVVNKEPKNVNEALMDDSWIVAMQEELNQFIANDVWALVPQHRHMTIIGTEWVFRNKLEENCIVSRNKARLVAQGYN